MFFTCLQARLPPVARQAEPGTGQPQREPRTKGWHGSTSEAYLFHTISPAPVLTASQPPTSPRGAPSSPDTASMQLGGCQHSASPTCCLRNKQRDTGLFSFLLYVSIFFPPSFCSSGNVLCAKSQGGREERGGKKERRERWVKISRPANIFWMWNMKKWKQKASRQLPGSSLTVALPWRAAGGHGCHTKSSCMNQLWHLAYIEGSERWNRTMFVFSCLSPNQRFN